MSISALTQAGLNLIQQALSIFDSDLKLVLSNRPMQSMFDLPDALVTPGASFQDVIRHLAERGEYGEIDDIDSFLAARVHLARAFQPHYMERTRSNGRTISVEGAPLPQGGWVTVYTDITATKAQEQLLRTRSELLSEEVLKRSEELSKTNRELGATNAALEEARRQLAEMEARTRATTEMMPAHIARVDAEGCYTFSNRKLSSVMPGRPNDILGQHIGTILGEQAFSRVGPHLEQALAGRQSTFEFSDEISSRRIRVSFTPDPVEPGVYILSQDVTEETQSRAALQQTRRREMAAQLTSGMAHDFSNLLTIILGMQSKLERMALPPHAEPLIAATLQAARRGGTLLGRIADITSQRSWQPKAIRMAPFLSDLATLATPSLPRDITLQIEDHTRRAVLVDPGMLQDALLNLVLNARDSCGQSGRICIEAQELQDTWLQIIVTDTGPGFSETGLDHGLDPFFTTKGSEGSGLGLAMVYDMTKLAGGSVRLANGEVGARITLRLPLRPASASASAATLPPGSMILLVDDVAELRETVRGMLTDLDLVVVEAASVPEALALARDLPDLTLVLSDITLEGPAPGTDLAGQLGDLPLRFMTALPQSNPLFQRAAAHGPVLRKPFTAEGLAAFLNCERQPE